MIKKLRQLFELPQNFSSRKGCVPQKSTTTAKGGGLNVTSKRGLLVVHGLR